MADLRIERVAGEASLQDWRHVHNVIIPPDALSLREVRERAGRHLLDVAYLGDVLVGCMTVRRPTADAPSVATVIARILPAHRGQGFGTALYAHGLDQARALVPAPDTIETIVLGSNEDGLRFARSHGFEESERYVLPGATVPYVHLRVPCAAARNTEDATMDG
ncbi:MULTISPECIES: GNAT family N-acetyltransferase [unclassified Streptomyces]|uniref:GNAT family N-acetyltransferase n=1 Tax=unclassified Streptomyces TaxID=2593676 RepID=UPI002E280B37|nr:GNAT family N-acetyltransferase [Streptomyces sp. NBC_00272]